MAVIVVQYFFYDDKFVCVEYWNLLSNGVTFIWPDKKTQQTI